MTARASWLIRVHHALALAVLALTLAVTAGCGRSSLLDDALVDSDASFDASTDAEDDGADGVTPPPDAAACSATTCPDGCCDPNGACQPGDGTFACGAFGETCHDCIADGFQTCDPKAHACGSTTDAGCDPKTCPAGCCENGVCLNGFDPNECGTAGLKCAHCAASGLACDRTSRTCVAPKCGPANCTGCCAGDSCVLGSDIAACGQAGALCQDCKSLGQTCAPTTPGGRCVASPTCDATNCKGCCDGTTCRTGTDATACGTKGGQCQSCAATASSCMPVTGGVGGTCQAPVKCGPSNCSGCCVNDKCVAGGTDASCGFGGATCMACQTGASCVNSVCVTKTTCGPSNCSGCCVGNSCFNGTDNVECGAKGSACKTCATGTTCTAGVCTAPPACGPSNCKGCCSGNTCVVGTTTGACGLGGFACQACSANQTCTAGVCQTVPTCGPQSCGGCCVNGVCAVGGQTNACGAGGATCQDCGARGQTCVSGACAQPACGPSNCNGCCSNGVCVGGTTDAACGARGVACTSCGAGRECTNQTCVATPPPCGPATCPLGCCGAQGLCEGGFLNSSCGDKGASCVDCTQTKSQCNTNASPRACRDQSTCPVPYNACPASATTPVPSIQHVCTASDLQQARAACAGGPTSAACIAFFAFEQATNPGCNSCLAPFDETFGQLSGVLRCAAPFVDAACNHATGCILDCETTSCNQCPTGDVESCETTALGNQCSSFVNGAGCAAPTLFAGAAAFCNPNNYANFGRWLQGVGGHFCGP
jgi:hypothetical protein